MSDKQPFELEFVFKASPNILYNFLSTASGLAQWFADKVDVTRDQYIFEWSGSAEEAICIERIDNELIRFKWKGNPDEEYFEFMLEKSEITNDTILTVSDFADPGDVENQKMLWESQIAELQKRVGG